MALRLDHGRFGGEEVRIFFLIVRREFINRVRSRFFIVGTLVFMALLAGYIVLQGTVLNKVGTTVKMGFTSSAQPLAQPLTTLAAAEGVKVEASYVSDVQSGEDDVRNGTLDALVSGDPATPQVAVKDDLNSTVATLLNSLVKEITLNKALVAAGADPAAIDASVVRASAQIVYLDPNAAIKTQREVVGVFVAALLYVTLVVYGQLVAAGVVEEKANRIIEILLATVKPRQLLLGKVVGIGLVGMLQLVLLAATALVTIRRTQAISVPNVGVEAVAGGLLWFVLGFVLYALLYAAAGSMVSRQEDIASVTTPLTFVVVGTYLVFFWVTANPTNPIAIALSVIPPFAVVLMPARIATGDAQLWQFVLAVILTLLEIAAMNWLAARIYSNSVLRIGTRVSLAQAWRGGH